MIENTVPAKPIQPHFPPKPLALEVLTDAIPVGMRERLQWVVWKFQYSPGKSKPWTKIPCNPKNGYAASHSNPDTWGTFDEAVQAYQAGGYDGIGYVFAADDPYCGVDLDGCLNPADGSITGAAQAAINRFSSYTEVSPSGTGIHIIIEGGLSGGGRKDTRSGIEVYDRQRFFCVTGRRLDLTPVEPQPRQAELELFFEEIFGSQKQQAECVFKPDSSPLSSAEQKILATALANLKTGEKMRLLYEGKYEEAGKGSHSEADLALCSYLAFWFNGDPASIDKVFRASKLYRPKWDQKHFGNGDTYGSHTVAKARAGQTEGYTGTTSRNKATTGFEVHAPIDIFGSAVLTGKAEWPDNACPSAIDRFARDEAERIGVDTAMVGLQAIGVATIATHDGFRVQPKASDPTWTEPPILWIGIVAGAGQKKTASQRAAKRPLVKVDLDLYRAHQEAMAQYGQELAAWKKNGEKEQPPVKPMQRRLFTNDTTVEALRRILVENTRGVGIINDELAGLIASFDAYKAQGKGVSMDRAAYCEAYQGGPKRFDRAEKGALFVPHWGVSIVGNIQPGPVARALGGITDDGLTARFLFGHGEKRGRGVDRPPDVIAVETYANVIKGLVGMVPRQESETITFASEAQAYRVAISTMAETLQCLPDTSDALRSHLNKLEGAYCRLALVYHLIEAVTAGMEYPPRQIAEATARMAATMIAEYLLPNSLRFYMETIDDGSHSAHVRWVAGFILSEKLETITKRDLMRCYRPFKHDTKALAATMNALYAAGWVEELDTKRTGEAISWSVNPAAHTKYKARAQTERERRAAERAKIQQAVKLLREAKGE